MFGSFPIARVFGTTVRVDLSWIFLILATAAFWPGDPLGAVLNLLMVFGLVVLHEFGHTFAARAFGIEVIDITLWFLGGMARMREIPEKPFVEGAIALAGPAVNFLLAALAVPVAIGLGIADMNGVALDFTASAGGLVINFILVNLFMGVSNLLPAFPMDGGRVFRAVCGAFTDWLTATRVAAAVGKLFSIGLIVTGFVFSNLSVVAVGVFVWMAASREVWVVRVRHAQRKMQEATFGGFPPDVGPRPAVFTEVARESAPAAASVATKVERVDDDPSGARRPSDNPLGNDGRLGESGRLDDEAVRKLEQFRGSLRPDRLDREE